MRKIEIIEACMGEGFGYNEGVHEVPTELARKLISAGFAKHYKKKPERSVTDKGRKKGVSKANN